MAIDTRYYHDLGVVFRDVVDAATDVGKATLSLSPTGDLQLVNGKDKLAVQLARAIMNERVNVPLNEFGVTDRQIKTLILVILRNYKKIQVESVNSVDPAFIGFNVYRKGGPVSFIGDTSDTFVKVSNDPVTHIFTDTGLQNGFSYEYAISRMFKGGAEGPPLEQMVIAPSQFLTKQKTVIGARLTGEPGDGSITLYVDTNRRYFKSELLSASKAIRVMQSVIDPRRWIIEVEIVTVLGTLLSLSIGRQVDIT
jgi:hypothetical protein